MNALEELDRLLAEGVTTISIPKAGEMLDLGECAARKAAANGQIPVMDLGRFKRVPIPAFKRMLETGIQPTSAPRAA